MAQTAPVTITYFSDVLCVWAYAAQIRLDEIHRRFGENVKITYSFCSVFGNSAGKIARGWADKGGNAGFNRHLRDLGAQYSHIDVHPDVWLSTRPASSDSAHIFIKAIQISERSERIDENGIVSSDSVSTRFIWQLRRAFFHKCRNISMRSVQCEVAEQVGIPRGPVEAEIESGSAFAALAADYQEQDRLKIEGSPTFVLNQGRQKLYGNLGYRVIDANIRELLRTPGVGEMSWC